MTDAPDAPIRDAATVVVLRQTALGPAVLMGMRGARAAFMPSKFVFPGGAVDPEDHIAATGPLDALLSADLRPESGADGATLIRCALRELHEETGLVLQNGGLMRFFFRAITPPGGPRRFDARFFLIDAATIDGDPDDFSRASDELSHLHWVPLAVAGDLDLPFITEVVLAEAAAIAADDRPRPVPFFDNRDSEPRFVYLSR